MENLRYLLAAIAALTLIMSVVSSVNPSYFAGLSAFADHDEDEEDNDNSGSNDEEREEEDDEERDDDEHEEEDDDDKGKSGKNEDKEHEEDEDELVQSLGNHSNTTLEIDDEAELQVEIEDGDLDDGTYDVMFACDSPDIDKEFADALDVEDGEGEFEADLALSNGTYTGCEVEVGELSATFPSFNIMPDDEDEEKDDDDEDEREGEDKEEREEREHEGKEKSKLKVEDEGVEIEVELKGLNMTDGSYDAVFACESPDFSVTLDDAFEVEDGEGELEAEIGLANGTYSGCDITVEGTALASFDTFTVSEETEEEQEVEEKRKERKERIVSTTNGTKIHERHRSENAASPGDYRPGWNYTLKADGTAMHEVHDEDIMHEANATVNIDMSVWKSNHAIILLDVVGGTVEVENQDYTIRIGYAIYSIQHDAMKMLALATDDDGNVFRLKLRGSAVDGGDQFPMESGSIDLIFGGSTGDSNNRFEEWNLLLEGTIEAS